jgi:hypothetical protein
MRGENGRKQNRRQRTRKARYTSLFIYANTRREALTASSPSMHLTLKATHHKIT